jgi:hypothetical protein
MRSLERVVRPFETPRRQSPQRTLVPYGAATENITLVFGEGGSGKVLNGTYNYTQTFYIDERWIEVPF